MLLTHLNRGDRSVTPRYMTKANSNPATFARMVRFGCGGGSNAVVFDVQGTCMPAAGDAIRIEYDTLCLAPWRRALR